MTRPRHANISQITSHLWIGGDLETRSPTLAAVQLREIIDTGITDIVDVRLERNDQEWVEANSSSLGYLWLGIDDAGQPIPDEWFSEGSTHAVERLDASGTVLAHCHMGINRGPSMGFAVLLAMGWDPVAALDRIRERRPIAHVAYAEDALDWWLRVSGANVVDRLEGRRRIREWRRTNHLDVADAIRRIRLQEGA